ncbi:MAG: tyrosine-type recombinase/integrase [Scytonema sp. PMC 1069.18]|nr:tyrosine-type recombinase/integrase [Scytonema sp. PMC 1069.18]MEC4888201.1 tyrosine-type recombinase/integrase [Scytonema sp. PMC 1070.18]
MQIQKGQLPDSHRLVWIVLDDDYLPVEPIQKYLRYLDSLEKSPNTIRVYANNLKLFWEFLQDKQIDWREITLEQMSDFIHWLRSPDPGVISIRPQVSKRSEKTINHALTTVCGFYEFQERLGLTEGVNAYRYQMQPGRKYKSFLHHISKGKEIKTRLLKVKEPKTFPGCLTNVQVKQLVDACHRIRDKFLICLLYETGMRIGEVLGLRHEDIHSQGVNEIHIIPRDDNVNVSRVKAGVKRVIHVSKDLMKLYSSYLIEEYPEDIDCDYVFVNCWDGETGKPMSYGAVNGLFKRLAKNAHIDASPHLLRHTHATELIRAGWDMAHVQKRLGHTSIQTTINTYVHLTDDDLQQEYQKYLNSKKAEDEN